MGCREPSKQLLEQISAGLKDAESTLTGAALVEVHEKRDPERFAPSHFVAANVTTQTGEEFKALWAVSPTGEGSLVAVNDGARKTTDWGVGIGGGGTMGRTRPTYLLYPEAQEALDCLER